VRRKEKPFKRGIRIKSLEPRYNVKVGGEKENGEKGEFFRFIFVLGKSKGEEKH